MRMASYSLDASLLLVDSGRASSFHACRADNKTADLPSENFLSTNIQSLVQMENFVASLSRPADFE